MVYYKNIFITLFLCLAFGCGGGGGSDDSGACSVLNARIFGGESCSLDARPPVVALIGVGQRGEELLDLGFCSASLVTLDDILTSAHCFEIVLNNANRFGVDDFAFAVAIGDIANRELIRLVSFQIHPFYDGSVGSRYDIAMATLASVPEPAIGPLPILVSELTGRGSSITAFGYGSNNDGEVGELKAANFEVTSLTPGNLIVLGDGESSICGGDSGGPAAYVTSTGITTLAGVNSFGGGGCEGSASRAFGFVDVQFNDIVNFILDYAPDVATR